ncbi:MAG: hypothetical protein OMM_00024 [Candidatus Magnetoglobus multicellularis str. Araruama]|uniref:Uncharacterized protein n=1 Tax=Candidatus Magnetoglobus multicellularis str. Araruama TaxID=890399 RepID=A0A1V1PIX4_9BACT|nr:MAG: hypothetical protein OMM_00024 [Candidatus Magnetoglobus multicellularis str. Araruama]
MDKKQLEYLPDGIRQSSCKHAILELKYTESISQLAIYQTMGYFGNYARLKRLDIQSVSVFVLSSKSPQKKLLDRIGYGPTEIKGVYASQEILAHPLKIISLNELTEEKYNLWIKLFSSKKKQRLSVLKKILSLGKKTLSRGLLIILMKIIKLWNAIGEITMQEINKDVFDDSLDVDEEMIALFLTMMGPKRVLKQFKPEDIFSQFKPEDIFRQFKPEDIFSQFKPEDVFRQFKPEDIFSQFKPEELLRRLDLNTIEDYLAKEKSSRS